MNQKVPSFKSKAMNKHAVIKHEFSADELYEAFDSFEEQITEAIKTIAKGLKQLRLAFHSRRRVVNHYRHPRTRKVLKNAHSSI
jgi:hypothetical protein